MKKICFAVLLFQFFVQACNDHSVKSAKEKLDGTWYLTSIGDIAPTFDSLYSNKKPALTFIAGSNEIKGNNSCNSFTGNYKLQDSSISFSSLTATEIFCEGQGETIFMDALKKFKHWQIKADTLVLSASDDFSFQFIKDNNK